MNTQQLESFIQVAENLNFARAAENLNLTQSAVSRQIHALEEELGSPLFKRSTRNVSLTPAGIIFLNDAKEALAKLQVSQLKIKNHMEEKIEILTIGCMNDAYLSLITPILKKCQKYFPDIHPILRVTPFRLIINTFLKKEVELLFGFKNEIPMQENIAFLPLEELSICAVFHKEYPFSKEKISNQELEKEKMIICDSHQLPMEVSSLQNQFARKILNGNSNYCHDINIMLSLIEAGYGFGILPKLKEEKVKFIPLENESPLTFGIYYHKNESNEVIKAFLQKLK